MPVRPRPIDHFLPLSAPLLHTLLALADGLIVESDDRLDPALDDERRRYYRLTTLGRSVAEADVARLEGIIEMARAKKLRPRRA
jgi:hypothetical protein